MRSVNVDTPADTVPRIGYAKPILLVDDDEPILETLEECLRHEGYHVLTTSDPLSVAETVMSRGIEIVVLDIQMPEMDGLALLSQLKGLNTTIAAIVMTAYGSVQKAVEAMKRGAYDYLSKPFQLDEFVLSIRKAVERVHLIHENASLSEQIRQLKHSNDMIGASSQLERIREIARRVASTDVTVLVTGESGTGKELVANYLVECSTRSAKPFVKINCAALPESLLESELFGHERGSFTGAVSRHVGKFELADGGTLFLDEISEMPVQTQTKLLRVLQEQSFQRIGGHEDIRVDVRILAATNKNPLEEVQRGNFREDLFYRLNVIEIKMPSLRERAEDIPVLVEHFLRYFAEKHGRPRVRLSSMAIKKLCGYAWPGNIRQLRNYLERVTLLDLGNELEKDIDTLVGEPVRPGDMKTPIEPGRIVPLDEMVDNYIRRVLEETQGNRTVAAQLLQIDPKTLRARLNKARV